MAAGAVVGGAVAGPPGAVVGTAAILACYAIPACREPVSDLFSHILRAEDSDLSPEADVKASLTDDSLLSQDVADVAEQALGGQSSPEEAAELITGCYEKLINTLGAMPDNSDIPVAVTQDAVSRAETATERAYEAIEELIGEEASPYLDRIDEAYKMVEHVKAEIRGR
jgi:hypothetical protein